MRDSRFPFPYNKKFMIVMKFGGSSVRNAERIRGVAEIVRRYRDRKPVVVLSALGGITDLLFDTAREALEGRNGLLPTLRKRHEDVAKDLGVDFDLLHDNFAELAVLLKGISLMKEITPRTLDYVVSFGERFSTRLIAAFFTANGIPAGQHDAFDIGMHTDDNFGSAQPLPEVYEEIGKRIRATDRVPVVTGYIGKTRNGDITTLGRNGSDFTASILGAAIGAEEIQIWTDVDGIMTADPNVCPRALPIKGMTFKEASELAYYGGRVLHPSTIVPAIQRGIPVKVLNTFKPEGSGTTVLAQLENVSPGVKAIVHRKNQHIVSIQSTRMLMGHGFLARIFEIFGRHKIVVNMVTTSEVTVSVTTDSPVNLDAAAKELGSFAEIEIEKDRTIVCVVGEGISITPGIAGDIFQALREAAVNVLMISQGASKINVAFVVADEDAERAVQALHDRFFSRVGSAIGREES